MRPAFKVLLCALFLRAELAEIPPQKNEVAAPAGSTALLPCHLQTLPGNPTHLDAVLWKKTGEVEEIVLYLHSQKVTNQSKAYRGRTTMSEEWFLHGEVTLTMENITENDAGEYSCWVKESSEGSLSENKRCSTKLYVEQQNGNGEQQQLIIAWSLYLLFLALCLCVSYRCGSQQKLQLK